MSDIKWQDEDFHPTYGRRILAWSFFDIAREREILEEGLIISCDSSSLIAHLFQYYGKEIVTIKNVPLFPKKKQATDKLDFGRPNTISFIFKPGADLTVLHEAAENYKYAIVNQSDYILNDNTTGILIQLEPKYLTRYAPSEFLDCEIFHLTTKNHITKIAEKGLSPKDSETIFSHPDNRIYLFVAKDEQYIPILVEKLSVDKNISPEDVVIYQVDGCGIEYQDIFVDGDFTHKSGICYAAFVLKNIRPEYIHRRI